MFCIALGELYDRPCNKQRGKDMGEEKAYSWTTEDGIIIECEIEVPEISNFCNVSLDAREFFSLSNPVVVLTRKREMQLEEDRC